MRNSWRANANAEEPKPAPGRPRCPAYVRKDARRIWKRLTDELEAMGILARADAPAIARYVELLAIWEEAAAAVQKFGTQYKVRKWNAQRQEYFTAGFREVPAWRVCKELAGELLRLEREFGLTPAARTRIRAEPTTEKETSAGKRRYFNTGS